MGSTNEDGVRRWHLTVLKRMQPLSKATKSHVASSRTAMTSEIFDWKFAIFFSGEMATARFRRSERGKEGSALSTPCSTCKNHSTSAWSHSRTASTALTGLRTLGSKEARSRVRTWLVVLREKSQKSPSEAAFAKRRDRQALPIQDPGTRALADSPFRKDELATNSETPAMRSTGGNRKSFATPNIMPFGSNGTFPVKATSNEVRRGSRTRL